MTKKGSPRIYQFIASEDLKTFNEVLLKLIDIFNDSEKAHDWIDTRNPHLGDVTPIWLISHGRGHKVMQFIDAAMEENKVE